MILQPIKKGVLLVLVMTTLICCNSGTTLQTYYVDNELQPGFATYDIPASIVDVADIELTEQQERAYESVSKLNVLTYKRDPSQHDTFDVELAEVKKILSNSKYEELMRGGNATDGRFVVKFLGDVDEVDELIILGSANTRGFVIARVLGNAMNAKDLVSLKTVLDKVNINKEQFGELTKFFQ